MGGSPAKEGESRGEGEKCGNFTREGKGRLPPNSGRQKRVGKEQKKERAGVIGMRAPPFPGSTERGEAPDGPGCPQRGRRGGKRKERTGKGAGKPVYPVERESPESGKLPRGRGRRKRSEKVKEKERGKGSKSLPQILN